MPRPVRALLVLAAYLVAAIVFTWPALPHLADRLVAPIGPGDPFLNLWILGWDLRAIGHAPLSLFTGAVFQANIFYPADLTLAYSDHLILQALVLWPLWALTGNLVLCYNTLLLASLVASALAMYALAWRLTASRQAAFLAGLAWGFWPYHTAHLVHLQLQALYFLPLTFLCLHRFVAAPRRREAVWLGLVVGLQIVSSSYYGIIGAIGLAVAAVVLVTVAGRRVNGRFIRRLVLAGVIAVAVAAPFVWPYWRLQASEGFARNLYQASMHEATVTSYARVPPANLLYGRTGWLRPAANAHAPEGHERELFPGFVIVGLALWGAWRARRRDSWPAAAAFLAVAGLGFVLSLGPDGIRPLYATLHTWVFGFQAIRAPARFAVLVMFGLTGLAAIGLSDIVSGQARRALAPLVCVVALCLEYANAGLPLVAAPPTTTEVGRWLAQARAPGSVLYLPLTLEEANTPFMVESLEHGRPIVNGMSGQRPPFYSALVETMQTFPSAESLLVLHDLGVRFVVAPGPVDAGRVAPVTESTTPLVERARFAGTFIYEMRWTPAFEAALPKPDLPPPLPPGPLPFGRGEVAIYQVTWVGMSVGLSAGDIRFSASRTDTAGMASPVASASGAAGEQEPPEARLRFTVSLQTAPWVSRFFEASDRLETWTDDSLLPLVGHQHIREGRRVLDRTTSFDAERRLVRLDSIDLPMAPGTRDPLSAFYYVRALPLAPGYQARIPVSEGGRQLALDVRVTGTERVNVHGREIDALRVEPRIIERIQRRPPIIMRLWLSRDDRRIPVLIEADAPFGSFRAVLVDYRRD